MPPLPTAPVLMTGAPFHAVTALQEDDRLFKLLPVSPKRVSIIIFN